MSLWVLYAASQFCASQDMFSASFKALHQQQWSIAAQLSYISTMAGTQILVHIVTISCCMPRGSLDAILLQVSLDVRGKRTLEESLDLYVQGELMEGDNQYLCEEAGKKVL